MTSPELSAEPSGENLSDEQLRQLAALWRLTLPPPEMLAALEELCGASSPQCAGLREIQTTRNELPSPLDLDRYVAWTNDLLSVFDDIPPELTA